MPRVLSIALDYFSSSADCPATIGTPQTLGLFLLLCVSRLCSAWAGVV